MHFDQSERAAQLLESFDSPLHQAAVMTIVEELLKQILYFADTGEEFVPDKIK
ncbi:hypothetical protein [Halopseudomonas xinjiangensis]|uniref:hypothetical protein n=1 Tax=Halopseudomonas xinjiangensis TaxID=487184 RepID=UPI00155FFAFD|nr:hypothetical protein [Halopseudomonas xinjiangensis]